MVNVEEAGSWSVGSDDPALCFGRCKEMSAAYAAHLRARGDDARWIQLSGSPEYPEAYEAWREIPKRVRVHYVVKTGSSYVDWAARQFDPSVPVPVVVERHGWDVEYDITDALDEFLGG